MTKGKLNIYGKVATDFNGLWVGTLLKNNLRWVMVSLLNLPHWLILWLNKCNRSCKGKAHNSAHALKRQKAWDPVPGLPRKSIKEDSHLKLWRITASQPWAWQTSGLTSDEASSYVYSKCIFDAKYIWKSAKEMSNNKFLMVWRVYKHKINLTLTMQDHWVTLNPNL